MEDKQRMEGATLIKTLRNDLTSHLPEMLPEIRLSMPGLFWILCQCRTVGLVCLPLAGISLDPKYFARLDGFHGFRFVQPDVLHKSLKATPPHDF